MEVNVNHENINNILLSRNSSAGFSYFRCNEGIPFEWEMQPGISKHPQQQQHIIPPLTPPPAILSSNLPTPSSMSHHHHPHFSSKLSSSNFWSTKLLFWKRNTTSDEAIIQRKHRSWRKKFDGDDFGGVNQCLSGRESMAMSLPFDSSFSSASFSSGSQSPVRGMHGKALRSCFPMHMRKIQLVSFARRN